MRCKQAEGQWEGRKDEFGEIHRNAQQKSKQEIRDSEKQKIDMERAVEEERRRREELDQRREEEYLGFDQNGPNSNKDPLLQEFKKDDKEFMRQNLRDMAYYGHIDFGVDQDIRMYD